MAEEDYSNPARYDNATFVFLKEDREHGDCAMCLKKDFETVNQMEIDTEGFGYVIVKEFIAKDYNTAKAAYDIWRNNIWLNEQDE